ncbi:MAG: hypothetical protein ABMA64_11065 [Myxococcota bacterium]
MQNIKHVLDAVPALHTATRSDLSGNVSDAAGRGEPDVVAAVASLSLQHLDELSEMLGLGPLQSWGFGTERASLYVVKRQGTLIAASGESARNVESTLKMVVAAVESL